MTHLYVSTIRQMTKQLSVLDAWLEKGQAHAEAIGADAELLLQARLVFDQHPLIRQVQASCDAAKFTAARTAGKDAPADPDDETTIEQARARIAKTVAYLEGFEDSDFEGAGDRVLTLSFLPEDKRLGAEGYLVQMAQPNFYFHMTTAYSILRQQGVQLGKRDFIGSLPLVDA